MFRCKQQFICAFETRQRHAPTLWRYRFEKFDAAFYQEIMLSSGVFRRETASGFYPWGKVEGPRKRVAEGLFGWRHGNSFPMTQSAQSLRQMRSIPRCSKAVFFVFDSIHEPATMPNLFPGIFYQWKNLQCFLMWIFDVVMMRAMVRMVLMSASNGNSPACGTPIFSMASAPITFCSVR